MTGYERVLATTAGSATEVVPRTPILMQYAAEYIGRDYAAFAADHRVLVEANLACARAFDFDQVSCISDPHRETHAFGADIEYLPAGPPRCAPPLAGAKDLELLRRPDPQQDERLRDRILAVEAFQQTVGREYSILGWVEGPAAEAADLRGVTAFMMDLFDDEAFAGALMDRCLQVAIDFACAQVEAGADAVGIGDAIASQVDPRTYERLIQPREKQLVQAVQGLGAAVKLHICGDITHLLPGIADLGVDVLDVDHMVDLAAVRAAVGGAVVITGNMDPVAVVRNGTPASIRAAVAQAYEQAGNPYMVNAGCEVPSGTPVENLRALCEPVAYRP